jgi:signal peptidase I
VEPVLPSDSLALAPSGRPSGRSLSREYLEALLIAVIFATFARTFIIQAFKIPSGSMEQTLLVGDHILVNKFIYGPTIWSFERRFLPLREVRRADVVVFRFPPDPSRDFIKRAIGLPGDRLKIEDKQLTLNGQLVDDGAYAVHSDPVTYPRTSFFNSNRQRDNFGPYTVPPDGYFCLGDNRDNSRDSRYWGTVPTSNLKGRALAVYWSYGDESGAENWPGLMGRLRQLAMTVRNLVSQTRWERTLRVVR